MSAVIFFHHPKTPFHHAYPTRSSPPFITEDLGGSAHAPIIGDGKDSSPFRARTEAASASYPPNAG